MAQHHLPSLAALDARKAMEAARRAKVVMLNMACLLGSYVTVRMHCLPPPLTARATTTTTRRARLHGKALAANRIRQFDVAFPFFARWFGDALSPAQAPPAQAPPMPPLAPPRRTVVGGGERLLTPPAFGVVLLCAKCC